MLDRSFIETYAGGAGKVAAAIHGLTREQLLAFPVPGTWSIQQIVIHLADAEQVFADRIKRVVAEESATLLAFDEKQWSANLAYDEQSAQDAAALIELTRRQMVRILKAQPDARLERSGVHSQAGPLTLRQVVEKASGHLEHHLKFIVAKREKLSASQ